MISHLRIQGYKTLVDAEARLGGLTVILGPLGSGRTNLLEATALLNRLAAVERLERAFVAPNRGSAAECLRDGSLAIAAEVEINPRIPKALNGRLAEREKLEGLSGSFTRVAERRMRYEVALDLLRDSGTVRLRDESLVALTATGTPRGDRRPFFERDDANGRFAVRLEKQGRVRYFGGARRRTLLSEGTDLVYHPHPAAIREELLGIRRHDFETSALLAPAAGPPPDGPGYRGESFAAFLDHIAGEEADALRRFEERLQPTGLEHIDRSGNPGGIWLRMRGDRVPLHLAPVGLLRLVAYAAVLECAQAPTVALLDEPENGLDRVGLATLARVLRAAATGRRPTSQVVVVTNSLDLATFLEPATVLACRREPERGTVLSTIPGEAGDLFRKVAMERALEGAQAQTPTIAPRAEAAAKRRARVRRPRA